MARDALQLLTGSLPDVAAELGVSIYTLRDWRLLRRAPSPEVVRALAGLLKRRSKTMAVMARKLEREGGAR
jgi:transcriptional regulator with XRE-family HTH domain